ncbi:hypothetical protein F4859DRAFT_509771 [Xylaria cf. heliscus]|nr:hypothetical protein F4859DRAFT_509771 [Xylaria cf. heliscus]
MFGFYVFCPKQKITTKLKRSHLKEENEMSREETMHLLSWFAHRENGHKYLEPSSPEAEHESSTVASNIAQRTPREKGPLIMPTNMTVNIREGEVNNSATHGVARPPHTSDAKTIQSLHRVARRPLRVRGRPTPYLGIPKAKRRNSVRLLADKRSYNHHIPSATAPNRISQFQVQQPKYQPNNFEADQRHSSQVDTQKPGLANHEDDDCFIVAIRKIEPPPAPLSLPPFATFHQFSSLTPPDRSLERRPPLSGLHSPLPHRVVQQLPSFAELVESTTDRRSPPLRSTTPSNNHGPKTWHHS